jgi:Tfp pilus assembly protein PilV
VSAERRQAGFGLVELLIATLVSVTCMVGVALMILYGTRLAAAAGNATLATGVARAELERLRVLPREAAEREVGGQLGSNQPAHFAHRGRFTCRWQVADGAAGTQDVNLVVLVEPGAPLVRLRALVR